MRFLHKGKLQVTLYTGSIAPYTVSIAPYTGSIAPYTVSIAPYTGSIAPYTVSIAPYTGSIAPYTGSIAPYTGSIAPYTGSIALYTGSIALYTVSIAPYTGSIAPYTGSIAPYTGSIALYSLSREIRWSLLYFGNIHSWICAAQRLHARTSVSSYTSVNIYNFNSRLAHFNALWMEYIRSLRTGIMAEYPDVHFAGHLRSNRTNIWSDKSNIRNMQSGGARGLELRTYGLRGPAVYVEINCSFQGNKNIRFIM